MIEDAADRLGGMLMEIAEGRADHSYEDLAAAVLDAGLRAACERRPSAARTEAVAAAIHGKLHRTESPGWTGLSEPEKSFWFDMARVAIAASDGALRDELNSAGGDESGKG